MPAEIVIVDDDPLVGDLSNDLLTDAGYTTRVIRDSTLVMDALKEHQPRLVLLDILMPGIDGLTLLHAIKQDPKLASTHVAVVSGKSFSAEIDRAKEYGAELFIQKPYDVKTFARQVNELIGPPDGGAGSPGEAPSDEAVVEEKKRDTVSVRLWGKSESESTAVVSVETMGEIFILDAGKGIVQLGERIIEEGRYRRAWLLLSHFHPDHISGLGLFPCLRAEGFELHISGPREPDRSLADMMRAEIKRAFATQPTPVTAKLQLHELREETYELLPGIRLSPFYANHPGTTLAYLLELSGRRLVYCPDSEIYGEAGTALQDYDEKIGRVCRGADLLIHDARYRDEEHETHKNQGHSGVSSTAQFAAEYDAKRLILFHPDPSYSDADLDAMEAGAAKVLDDNGAQIPCKIARDGAEMQF